MKPPQFSKTFHLILSLFFLLAGLHGGKACAAETVSPGGASLQRSGEYLEYDVYWTKLLVGKISVFMHGSTQRSDQPCIKLEAYARTTGAVETLYSAKYRYMGYLRPDHRPWLYEEWEKDGKWRLQEWLEFPNGTEMVRRFKKNRLRNEIKVPAGTFDPVSAAYALLSTPLSPGNRLEVSVTQGKDLYHATADIQSGPVLDSLLGPVPTVEVTPKLFFEGKPLGKRVYKAWITQDSRCIPVQFWIDIEYGSFTATLAKYRPPSQNPLAEPILSRTE